MINFFLQTTSEPLAQIQNNFTQVFSIMLFTKVAQNKKITDKAKNSRTYKKTSPEPELRGLHGFHSVISAFVICFLNVSTFCLLDPV